MSGIERSVASFAYKRVKIVFRRIYSSRGPQLFSQNILLNTERSPLATTGYSSTQVGASSILKAVGKFLSEGSKSMTSFVRDLGMFLRIVSARSPWGSITATHFPADISEQIIFSRRVDFPIPVFPTMYICLNRSHWRIQKCIFLHRKSVTPIGVTFSHTGKFEGGSSFLLITQWIPAHVTARVGRWTSQASSSVFKSVSNRGREAKMVPNLFFGVREWSAFQRGFEKTQRELWSSCKSIYSRVISESETATKIRTSNPHASVFWNWESGIHCFSHSQLLPQRIRKNIIGKKSTEMKP